MAASTTLVLEDPDAVAAATHPVRAAILDAMREPSTAADVARAIGQSRQNVAYHVRELERVGLLRHVDERRKGNFVEQRYRAAAGTLVVSPTCTWGDRERRARALADQLSLATLFEAGQRLQHDAALLLDRAAFDGEEIASASAVTELRFRAEEDRAAFLREYTEALTALVRRHGARRGDPYRLVLAAYRQPEDR